MKKVIIIFVMVMITAIFYSGCGKSDQESQKQSANENSASSERYKISALAEARFDDLKNDYLTKVKTKIDDINQKIEALQLKKKGAPESLLEPIEASLKIAIEKNEVLAKQFTKLENADENNFAVEKTAMVKALSDAEKAYEELKLEF